MTAKELAKFYDALLNKKEIPKGIKNIRILSNNLSEFLDKLYSDFFSPSTISTSINPSNHCSIVS